MKTRSIRAILLSTLLISSTAFFSSCDGEKKENNAANEAPATEVPSEESATPESAPIEEVNESDDASVEATPEEPTETPVEEVKEVVEDSKETVVEAKKAVEEKVEEVIEAKPNLVFDHTQHEFGTIQQGEKVEHLFTFTNKGNAPLIINSAKPSCGCTVPSWPKEPIMPGETGEIKAIFNSAGKSGTQNKSIRVFTNMGDQPTNIYLKGKIELPAPKPVESPIAE